MKKLTVILSAGLLAGLSLFGPAVAQQHGVLQPTPDEFKKLQDDLKRLVDDNAKLAAQVKADEAKAKVKADANAVDKAKAASNGPAAQPSFKLKADPPKDGPDPRFKTGAKRTPIHKVIEAIRTGRAGVHKAKNSIPATVAMVPVTLSMLGNDRYGDCVTAESAAAIEAYSVSLGLPEIIITDSATIAWAGAHGDLNGAELLPVIQDMERDGIKDSKGVLYKAGTPSSVDYTDEATLRSAIAVGPVSIAIGSGDLPSGAGNNNGWYALASRGTANDHCVGLWGYGKAEDLYKALGLPCPAACIGKTGYLLYTWSTIGFVTHAWIVGTVQEAWVRTPTVVGLQPPTPTPITVAVGDVSGVVGKTTSFFPIVTGGTPPYFAYSYDYGDGSARDGAGSHVYATAGTFRITVTVTDAQSKVGSGTCTAAVTQTPVPPLGTYPQVTLDKPLAPGTYLQIGLPAWQRMQDEQASQRARLEALEEWIKTLPKGTMPPAKPQDGAALDAVRSEVRELAAKIDALIRQRLTVVPGAKVIVGRPDGGVNWEPLGKFITVGK